MENIVNANIAKGCNVTKKVYAERMLGVVTLYHPNVQETVANIEKYVNGVDSLIIWDNSPLEENVRQQMQRALHNDVRQKIIWHGTGRNECIAPAINYALHYALKHDFSLLLVMDQDSEWENFSDYREDIETRLSKGEKCIFTPYVKGCDTFKIKKNEQEKHLMINSGMIIPIKILAEIGGVDEKAFPLDALDHDITYSVREYGYSTVCLTKHVLNHTLGQMQRMGLFNIMTPNYNWFRTYSMTRSHIICYRKHKKNLKTEDRQYLFREILLMKFLRIILAEPDKFRRMKAFVKGVYAGLTYSLM